MNKLEHIGIAVKNLESSNKRFTKLFGKPPYKEEVVKSEAVKTSFFKIGNTKIELLEATEETSVISKFIENKGEGIHHIAFEVNDIKKETKRLKKQGFKIINNVPKKGADNKRIIFLHPKQTKGVLIELCQEINK